MSPQDDEKLSAYLNANAPQAPSAKPDEKEKILALIHQPQKKFSKPWMPWAMAASLFVVAWSTVIYKSPSVNDPFVVATQTPSASILPTDYDETSFYTIDAYALDEVGLEGEDYAVLAADAL